MDHNVFISWSGMRAHKLAVALREFIGDVIQNAEPWISSEDIEKGQRWKHMLADALKEMKIGIIVLTPENLNSNWILFEAGALAKTLNDARVSPYLLDLEPSQVKTPLADFQMTRTDKADTLRLISMINVALGSRVPADRLQKTFDRFWPDLEQLIAQLEKDKPAKDEKVAVPRKPEDMLAEIMERLRSLERRGPYIEIGPGEVFGSPPPTLSATLMHRGKQLLLEIKSAFSSVPASKRAELQVDLDRAHVIDAGLYKLVREGRHDEVQKSLKRLERILSRVVASLGGE